MSLFSLIIVALSLSFDTFAVSVSSGLMKKEIAFYQAVRVAFWLALFQALMPIAGWAGGLSIKTFVEPYVHWVALALLATIGIKMIADSFRPVSEKTSNLLVLKTILTIAFATSFDALAVGVSFAMIDVNLLLAVFVIGSVTFVVAMLGILMGKKSGARLGKPMEVLGGVVLIAIGVKIVLDHYQ